jgi:hypothetical protein
MRRAIAEGLLKDREALETREGMFDHNPPLAERTIGAFELVRELRVGILAFARLLVREAHRRARVIGAHPLIAQVGQHLKVLKPGGGGRELVFEQGVIVMMPTEGVAHKPNHTRRRGKDGVFYGVALFLPL